MSDEALLADVRAALLVEIASVRIGVAAPQVRGRIADRQRARRRARSRAAAAVVAIAVVVAGLPVVGGLALPAAVAPAPGGVQPAWVASINPASGDLELAWAWSDGRTQAGARYRDALGLLRLATGDAGLSGLPPGAVATAGPDGRLAVALPTGGLLVYRSPADPGRVSRVVEGLVEETWLGWTVDGRLAAIARPFAAPDARLRLRLVDPATGAGVAGALTYGIWPGARGSLLTWTDGGAILVERRDPGTGAATVGTLEVADDRPAFEPGQPTRLRVVTGLEPALAGDGSVPRGWRSDALPGWSSVGVGSATSDGVPAVRWYAAPAGDRVFDVVRSADLLRLVALVARADGTGARLVVLDWPGSWRDAVALTGAAATTPAPARDPGSEDAPAPRVLGVAPDGRSVAAEVDGRLVVADLATGTSEALAEGTVFVGWPEPSIAVTMAVPTSPACVAATAGAAAAIALAPAGAPSPADTGVPPIVGDPGDRDPWRRDALAGANPVEATAGGPLVLAVPDRRCVARLDADAVRIGAPPADPPTGIAALPAGTSPTGGLIGLPAPAAPGEWIIRVRLRLHGAAGETTLLYRVRTAAP